MINQEYLEYAKGFLKTVKKDPSVLLNYDEVRGIGKIGKVHLGGIDVKLVETLVSKRFSDGSRCMLVVDRKGIAWVLFGVYPVRRSCKLPNHWGFLEDRSLSYDYSLKYCMRLLSRFKSTAKQCGYEIRKEAVVGLYVSNNYVKIREVSNPNNLYNYFRFYTDEQILRSKNGY